MKQTDRACRLQLEVSEDEMRAIEDFGFASVSSPAASPDAAGFFPSNPICRRLATPGRMLPAQ